MRVHKREKKFDNVVHQLIYDGVQEYHIRRLSLKHKFYLMRKKNKKN